MFSKVQTKLAFLICCITIIFLLGLILIWQSEKARIDILLSDRQEERQIFFERILSLKGASLESFAYDYTFWDEMVDFLSTRDPGWAQDNIITALRTFDAQDVWIFDSNFNYVYSARGGDSQLPSSWAPDKGISGKLFKDKSFTHFFCSTPSGVLEVRGATIHPTQDYERKTAPKGYFFAGRLWKTQYINELEKLTGASIQVLSPDNNVSQSADRPHGTLMSFERTLPGWDGKPVARLLVQSRLPVIGEISRLFLHQFYYIVVFIAVIIFFLTAFLFRWISIPLRSLSTSLQEADPGPIKNLLHEKTEFGRLAQLLSKFFDQKELLNAEIAERMHAEESLRLDESRLEALVQLNQMEGASLRQVTDFALEEGIRLTGSKIGFLAFLNAEESIMTMHAYSKTAMEECRIEEKPLVFEVEKTGLLGEAVRQRKPVVCNDYPALKEGKKGYPEGHVNLTRHLNIPVFDKGRIVLVAGVANKLGRYNDSDVTQLTLLMEGMWRLLERTRAEEERKRLEAQLLQAQKMEAVGQLAGGIAHNFNNMLTAIVGYGSLLEMRLGDDEVSSRYISNVLLSAEKAASLTKSLLSFSRKQILNRRPVNLNEIVGKVQNLLSTLIGADIDLVASYGHEKIAVMADAAQIEQALINLATNARDAMPGGGALTIKTNICVMDGEFVSSYGYGKPGKYACIEVIDTGHGMDEETASRVFEPFFTTKEVGKGTGLGLATVYSIVKQHEGYISVSSSAGNGTVFTLYLPFLEGEGITHTMKLPETPPRGGMETILLAEDDEEVRDFLKIVLREYGYDVIEAQDGEDGYRKFIEHQDKINLLISDLIMPRTSGKELYERVKQLRHDIKVLFMSGYPGDSAIMKGLLDDKENFIKKPIYPDDLLRRIKDLLHPA